MIKCKILMLLISKMLKMTPIKKIKTDKNKKL